MGTLNLNNISNIVLEDNATGGSCYNAYIKIKDYYKIIKEVEKNSDNEFQRSIINVKKSKVYLKLIKDLIKGVVIPTLSLYIDDIKEIKKSTIIDITNLKILDGLQRTNCILYAFNVLQDNSFDKEIMKDISNPLTFDEYKDKMIRLEIWVNLTVNGILYKMVSLNAGQTPMRIEHQFEVIELPLIRELKQSEITVYRKAIDEKRTSEYQFALSSVVESSIAYNYVSINPRKQEMAINFLDQLDIANEKHESLISKSEVFMEDLIWTLKDFHNAQINCYKDFQSNEFCGILANEEPFFIPFMAALGKSRNSATLFTNIDKKKNCLIELLKQKGDPLDLSSYKTITSSFRSGIGTRKRKLVYTAFHLFFSGMEDKINWNLANDFS